MGRSGTGVEVRETSIRISFVWNGEPRKETLRTDGKPMSPTPANVRWAKRLAAEIREKLRNDVFVYAEYFPASPNATTGHASAMGEQLDLWLGLQVGLESSTLKGYRVAVEWWKRNIGAKPLTTLKHSDILAALAAEPTWTGKTRNNKVSVLRQALQLALRDNLIKTSPLAGLQAAPHQKAPPDPFSLEEVELILAELRARYHPQVANYFTCKFFTGTRTSESLALRWDSIDFRLSHMLVTEAIVLGEYKDSTKTHRSRTVHLNSRALESVVAQREHTLLAGKGGWVFLDLRSGERWVDDWTPREMYWRPALRRLGIRYRSPYETRHTYATMMLMAGMRPAFCATQLGHSVEMFLRTYAKWVDGGRNDVEMGRLEGFLSSADSSRILPQKPVADGNLL